MQLARWWTVALLCAPTSALRAPVPRSVSAGRRAVTGLLPLGLLPLVLPRRACAAAPPAPFELNLPAGFVRSSRTATTGTVLVAGNFPRAAVISVTAWPVDQLFEQDAAAKSLPGLPQAAASPTVSAPTDLGQLGSTQELVNLLVRARDRDATAGALQSQLVGYELTSDRTRLLFTFETLLPVSDPEELYKQRGVRELRRRTKAVAVLGKVAPTASSAAVPAVFTAWGSALAQDWDQDLGAPIGESVGSFQLTVPTA